MRFFDKPKPIEKMTEKELKYKQAMEIEEIRSTLHKIFWAIVFFMFLYWLLGSG